MYNDLKRSVYFLKITDNPSRNPFLWLAATACSGSKSNSCDVAAAVAASIEREQEEQLGYCGVEAVRSLRRCESRFRSSSWGGSSQELEEM
jgi:hypothetical protein